jgi:glyoxylase-like metal-dependent hydrolase (beta-lactamase superfamily II)
MKKKMTTEPTILRIVTGAYQVNTYIVSCTETNEGFIIDPGGDVDKILEQIKERRIRIKYILNTHGHADHIIGNQELKKSLDLQVCMHKEDDSFFTKPDILKIEEKELGLSTPSKADIKLKDSEIITVGNLKIKVIHTPGHTPGSVCYLVSGNLFTGDTLFVGDVGRSDLAGGSFATLLQSIKEKIIVLPLKTKIWPGHDYGEMPTSSLAWEMKENPYITEFILA